MTGEIERPESSGGAVTPWTDTVAAVVAELDAASDEHAASLRPANTTRSYAADWKAWTSFITALNLDLAQRGRAAVDVTTVSRGLLRAFVSWLWTDKHAAPTTIDRRLAGVVVTLRQQHGVHVDPDATKDARELLKDYVRQAAEDRQAPRGRGQADPLLLPDLRKISAACPDTLAGIRDRALLLLAFSIAGRRSEVAGLMVRDVTDDSNGLVVEVRVSKTKPRTVAVPFGSNPATCPVRAWRAWREAAGLDDPDGPAFRRVDRHGRLLDALSGQAAGEIITRAHERVQAQARRAAEERGEELPEDGTRLTGHSARAGLATEARRAGKDRKAIAATTGHVPNSAVLDRYLRTVDRWSDEDNALMGIGL